MPRRRNFVTSSAFRQVQRQANALLAKLRNEIKKKEGEVRRLRDEESRLSALTGRASAAPRSAGKGAGRINWKTVLSQLPRQFKASDIRKVRGLADKRPSEIFAAITRWIEGGMAKRKKRGLYEKS